MKSCWDIEARHRPPFKKLAANLEAAVSDYYYYRQGDGALTRDTDD